MQSPTSKSTLVLTGSAEFGSTVKVTGGASEVTVTADPFTALFRAEVPLNTTIPAGSISVKNTLSVTATDAAGNPSDATTVDVVFGPEPGVPAKLNFALTGAAAGGTITAGTDVTYTYQVTDAYGGAVPNPLQVIPSDPGTTVFDDGISGNGVIMGFSHKGSFTITARATGAAGVSKVVPLSVTVAAGQRYVQLGLTLSRMATGDTTAALTVVKDLYNNVIIDDANGQSPGLALACVPQSPATPPAACAQTNNNFTITRAGVYKMTATYNDGTNPAASASQYVFVEDAPDVEPPVASISSIVYPTGTTQVPRSTNSRIEVQLSFTDNKALASAVLYAIFGNNPACVAASTTLQLTGQTSVTTNASVRQPACAYPLDTISLFASVVDEAGNQGFSAMNTTLSVSGATLGGTAGQNGYTLKVAALGTGGFLPLGSDLAWDPAAQIAYVTSPANNRIIALLPDRTRANLLDSTGQSYQPNAPGGIAVTGAGELFVGHFDVGNIGYIPPALPQNPPALATGLFAPTRVVFDSRPTPKPMVCAARTSAANSMNCYAFDSSVTPPTLTANFPASVVPVPAPTGANVNLMGVAVGAQNAGAYTLWLLYGGCALYSTTTRFDGTAPAAPSAPLTLTPALPGGATCQDITALPSGDVAVLVNQSVMRITPAGAATTILSGLNQGAALDFAGGALFVLDGGDQAVLQVSPPSGTPW